MDYHEALCLRVGDMVRYDQPSRNNPRGYRQPKVTIGAIYKVEMVETRCRGHEGPLPIMMWVKNDREMVTSYSWKGWTTLNPRSDIRDEVWVYRGPNQPDEKLTYLEGLQEQRRKIADYAAWAERYTAEQAARNRNPILIAYSDQQIQSMREVIAQIDGPIDADFTEVPDPVPLYVDPGTRRFR